jgi:2-keto-4-pentenoate hydratase
MAEGYSVQDLAIDLWPDELVGWKVGLVPPQHRERLGAERLAGCIFKSKVWDAGPTQPTPFRAIAGGFTAVEAEFIIRLGKDAPADKTEWTAEEAAEYVGELLVGVEIAGSPLATINPWARPSWRPTSATTTARSWVRPFPTGATSPGRICRSRPSSTASRSARAAATIPGSPLAALAFLLGTSPRAAAAEEGHARHHRRQHGHSRRGRRRHAPA